MKKLMLASLVGFSLMLSTLAIAGEGGKCKQGAQGNQKCCQSQTAKAGWFSNGSTASGAPAAGGSCSSTSQAKECNGSACKEKAQGQAPSGGSSETKEGGCCQQKK